MRTLHEQNQDAGFTVLAFPCNQFGAQEPGTDAEILEFARSNYGVEFPMFSKVEVNGAGACDLYQFLKAAGKDEESRADIAWNFTKFLVDREGTVVARFAPQVTPEEIAKRMPEYLG